MRKSLGLIFVLIFASVIYLYKINTVPSGIYVDEAVSAYDSYSIFKTGRDHYGKTLPFVFRFFGAYTPGLFVYLNTIPIVLFGLHPFAIRLVSVFSTLIQIFIIYKILQHIKFIKSKYSPLVGAFIFAILPWTVFNARLGYEVMFAQMVFTLAAYLLYRAISDPKYYSPGLMLLSLSTHTAHTQRYLAPIFFILYLAILHPRFKDIKRGLAIALLIQLPNFYLITTKSFWIKSSIYQNSSIYQLIKDFSLQMFQYLSPKTLFFQTSDIDQQHLIPQISLFYFWLVIPLLIGIYRLIINSSAPISKLVLILFLSGLLPASLSGHFISVQRALPLILPLSLIISIGLDGIPLFFLSPPTLYSFLLLWRSYFVLLPALQADAWNYGYNQIAEIIQSQPETQFLFDNSRNPRAYSLFLYYLKYSPQKFHQQINPDFSQNYYQMNQVLQNLTIGNLDIRPIDWQNDPNTPQIIIGDPLSISSSQALEHHLKLIKQIENPTHQTIFQIFQSRIK